MNQEQRLDFLLETLSNESREYGMLNTENMDKRRVLRSFLNIRGPEPVSDEFIAVQDAFLKQEAEERGIVELADIPTIGEQYGSQSALAGKVSVWQGDISRLAVDAIVNAANSQLLGCFVPCHGCIDNVIHSAAGVQLRQACHDYMTEQQRKNGVQYEEPTGSAVLTPAYNLPARYVLHTVGPIVAWRLNDSLKQDLRNCYEACLKTALDNGIKSIAFCCISTGEYHFPNEEAAPIAVAAVTEFLKEHEKDMDRIIFNVFKDEDLKIYEKILS